MASSPFFPNSQSRNPACAGAAGAASAAIIIKRATRRPLLHIPGFLPSDLPGAARTLDPAEAVAPFHHIFYAPVEEGFRFFHISVVVSQPGESRRADDAAEQSPLGIAVVIRCPVPRPDPYPVRRPPEKPRSPGLADRQAP